LPLASFLGRILLQLTKFRERNRNSASENSNVEESDGCRDNLWALIALFKAQRGYFTIAALHFWGTYLTESEAQVTSCIRAAVRTAATISILALSLWN